MESVRNNYSMTTDALPLLAMQSAFLTPPPFNIVSILLSISYKCFWDFFDFPTTPYYIFPKTILKTKGLSALTSPLVYEKKY